jgi:Cd(II)/Pb(II)-responsive transcriptional regulator
VRIGELAARTGCDVETIRYYERERLLPAPARTGAGYRQYRDEHVARLAFVRHCRALEMPLQEIRVLLSFSEAPKARDCEAVNALVDRQIARVQARLASLRALDNQLRRLRRQCRSGQTPAPCRILKSLVDAAHGEACACHDHASAATTQ